MWNKWADLHLQWQLVPFTWSGHFSFLSVVLSKLFLIRSVTCWWCATSYEQLANDILSCRQRIRSQASIRAGWWSVLSSKKRNKKTLQFAHLWSCNFSGLYFAFPAGVSTCFFKFYFHSLKFGAKAFVGLFGCGLKCLAGLKATKNAAFVKWSIPAINHFLLKCAAGLSVFWSSTKRCWLSAAQIVKQTVCECEMICFLIVFDNFNKILDPLMQNHCGQNQIVTQCIWIRGRICCFWAVATLQNGCLVSSHTEEFLLDPSCARLPMNKNRKPWRVCSCAL